MAAARHPSIGHVRAVLVAVIVMALAVGVTGCSSSDEGTTGDVLAGVDSYVDVPGSPLGPATQTVTQTDGTRWSFDADVGDRITLVYFGYTSCPDICPTTMADLAVALRKLPTRVADKITVRFVSTDPARDTKAQLRSWLGGFDPDFIGARAPIGRVIKAAAAYGTSIEPPKVTKGSYEVTHGAKVYVLQSGGGAVGFFRAKAGPAAYEKALPAVVKEFA